LQRRAVTLFALGHVGSFRARAIGGAASGIARGLTAVHVTSLGSHGKGDRAAGGTTKEAAN